MINHRHFIDIPQLTVLNELPLEELPKIQFELEPRLVSVCLFSDRGKPLEAHTFDLAQQQARQKLDDITRDLTCDDLSAIIWPQQGKSPLLPMVDLLRRLIVHYDLGKLKESAFLCDWIKSARVAINDFVDINELLLFEEAQSTSRVQDDDECNNEE